MIARFHYDRQTLGRFVNEEDGDTTAEMSSHIEQCELCQATLESLFADGLTMDAAGELLRDDVAELAKSFGDIDSDQIVLANPTTLLQPTDYPNSLGRFARFEIMEILGRGGMGIVMRGYDTSLDRHCAVKVLAPELATSAAARKRFSREAKSAAAVVHPHVVPIQTVDEHDGLPYLVMPVVEGKSLQQRVESDGPLSLIETVRIAMQVAEGLAAAHAQGLVHRDIKPANILLENGVERVQITDFGLARAVDDASMTRSGVIAGTPQYMSPEQAHGDEIDHRSDLFSLGSVMYFMLTGRSPFRSETTMGVLNRIGNDEPRSLRSINSEVPDWMEQIIGKLLSKSPEDRYQTATGVAALLQEWHVHLQQPEIVVRPTEPTALAAGSATLPVPAASADGSRIYRWLIGLAMFGFFAFAGVLIVLELDKGTLTVESEADNVPVRIMQGDHVVQELTVSRRGTSTRIAAGQYVVELVADFDDMVVGDGTVVLKSRDTATVRIALSDTLRRSRADQKTVSDTNSPPLIVVGGDDQTQETVQKRILQLIEEVTQQWGGPLQQKIRAGGHLPIKVVIQLQSSEGLGTIVGASTIVHHGTLPELLETHLPTLIVRLVLNQRINFVLPEWLDNGIRTGMTEQDSENQWATLRRVRDTVHWMPLQVLLTHSVDTVGPNTPRGAKKRQADENFVAQSTAFCQFFVDQWGNEALVHFVISLQESEVAALEPWDIESLTVLEREFHSWIQKKTLAKEAVSNTANPQGESQGSENAGATTSSVAPTLAEADIYQGVVQCDGETLTISFAESFRPNRLIQGSNVHYDFAAKPP